MTDSKKKSKKKAAKKKVGHTRTVEDGKTKIEDIEEDVVEESPGEEVAAAPAHVPPTVVKVRGTSVGGTKLMSAEEHAEYCEAEKKKAKKK